MFSATRTNLLPSGRVTPDGYLTYCTPLALNHPVTQGIAISGPLLIPAPRVESQFLGCGTVCSDLRIGRPQR